MSIAGTTIGRYQLLRLLAAGGMGEVYLARLQSSVEGFAALVAIKLLVRNLSSNQTFVKMFLDEARIVGKLRHKNIVQIRDISEQDGQYYMVMEYIPGQNLRELLGDVSISDRPLFEPRLGTEMFIDIVGALGVAHAGALVHRDISPNNIMISDEGAPKLIDFGVARALSSASLTSPGTLKGKFGYMAPEYVRAQAYDHRVDIFSLGVVMWETFARRRLFRGTSAAEQLHQLLESPIPRLDDVVPGFPADLATIISGALERDPQRRIASAGMLGDALSVIAQSLDVGKDPTLRKWLERRISGRLEDRRQMDATLLALPADAPIPDFGTAYPEAGSTPGTYGFQEAPIPGAFTSVDGGGQSATSIRLANGEAQQVPPPAAATAPSSRARMFVIGAVALLAAVLVIALSQRSKSAPPATVPATATMTADAIAVPAHPDVSLAEAHRQIGLKAMSDGDYARAQKEYEEALRNGGSGDLPKLVEIASQLERDDEARKTETKTAATFPSPTPATPTTTTTNPTPPQPTTKVAIATPPKRTVTTNRKATQMRETRETREPTAPREPPAPVPAPIETPPPPTTGNLVVTTTDPNLKAVVVVDGNVMGQSPLLLPRLPVGDHQLVVRVGNQVVRNETISIAAGATNRIKIETPPPREPSKPTTTTPTPTVVARPAPPSAPPTPRVTSDGDVGTGEGVVAGCNTCHVKAGKSAFSPRHYTRAQWERFFATGQHDRAVPIGDRMTASQMMAARAYLRANAADSAEDQGAGVRE